MAHSTDLAGQRYGDLVALHRTPRNRWTCACDCGALVDVLPRNLRSGNTRSCGKHKPATAADPELTAYKRAHHHVTRTRGPASSRLCERCGRVAAEWAYDWNAARSTGSATTSTAAGYCYSDDPGAYVPLCVSCHRRGDRYARAARVAEHHGLAPLFGENLPPLV